jgi:two-component system, sensor histidine kinase and response regulator
MKTKILLVEDEQHIRETLFELLTLNNYEVVLAEDGVKALQTLKKWTPNVIISDIMMPNCNGYDFYKLVRENPALNYIPFIFLTAKKAEEELCNANMIGVDAFVTKPFKSKELFRIIEARINRHEDIKNTYDLLDIKFDDYMIDEIYSPLKRILGVSNYLIENKEKLADNFKHVEAVKEYAEKLNRTLNNIITYNKLITDSYFFQTDGVTDPQNCYLEIYPKLSNANKNKISTFFKRANVAISRQDLLIVLGEIIDNAIKFTAKNEAISIKGNANLKTYSIKIKDFGTGMNQSQIDKIGPFVQFYKSAEEKQGLGLGLFISKKIIENNHGKLNIFSKEGEGTEVEITLPIVL